MQIPRLAKGKAVRGPDYFGCYNTGMAPVIYRALCGKYVVGPDMAIYQALHSRAGLNRLYTSARTIGKGRDRCYIYTTRKPAIAKFTALCNAILADNEAQRRKASELQTRIKSNPLDVAAALELGDMI